MKLYEIIITVPVCIVARAEDLQAAETIARARRDAYKTITTEVTGRPEIPPMILAISEFPETEQPPEQEGA